ncbi:hypothetical protein KP509_02G053600 [Ceratopteris richardii]|uniref:Cytochrome b5 heme-binding domain-containing protein n=1 Tax=Ceratopteris richardii TaxID=49495 RepID=A0A8T2V9I0_CERRI|nr:hypothetical protein KP509_02G053600 [Ceratopteris richardii]
MAIRSRKKDANEEGVSSSSERRPSRYEEERGPGCLGLVIALCVVAIVLYFSSERVLRKKLWTATELMNYNGTDENLPILLGILGSVYDVTKGRTYYGKGGSYNHFAGRDATRAFISGNFSGEGLTDSIIGLSNIEVKRLIDWRSFYSKTYFYVGKLVGTYYDASGKETKALRNAEAKAKLGEKQLKHQDAVEKKYPSCNSRWSQQDGGEVWCDSGYPRLVGKVGELPMSGQSKRCACFTREQLGKAGLEVYAGCDPLQSTCKVS